MADRVTDTLAFSLTFANTGASLHQDVVAYRMTGKWQKQQLPDDLSEGYLLLGTETMLLSSRVRDDKVRELADRLRSQTAAVGMSSDEREAEDRVMVAAATQEVLFRRIGKLLRELDQAD